MCPSPESSLLQEFSPEERSLLLKLAHDAIATTLWGQPLCAPASIPHLAEPRGVFTTLYHRGELRGCVGYAEAKRPLGEAVIETARGAAFSDPRFTPVRQAELADLTVSLSVLSSLLEARAEDVRVGRHGLVVSLNGHRGLLLPQVAVERGWDRLTFLEQTCVKAGLPAHAWQLGARLEVFTAEVFGD